MKTKLFLVLVLVLLAIPWGAIATPVAAQCTPTFSIDYVWDRYTYVDAEPSYVGQEITVAVGYGACGAVTITVDYGDGTPAGTGGPGDILYYHTYTAAGDYTITATLEDTVAGVTTSVTDTWAHTVVEAPPADSRIRLEQKASFFPYIFGIADAAYCADSIYPCSIAESVQVPASDALVISQIQLWGGYNNPATYTDDFTVVLRSDGDGPGDPVYREESVASVREEWAYGYVRLTLTLAEEQTLAGGSEGAAYWIEIYNNGTSAPPGGVGNYFYWLGGLPDADNPYYLAGASQGFAETNASWQQFLNNNLPVNLSLVLLAPGAELNPFLTGISPASAVAGSDDVHFTVTGSGFTAQSVVRWGSLNPLDLATTYISDSELRAVLPAHYIAVYTAQVTVYTPGGGTSNALAFFLTLGPAAVTSQDIASGTDPSASSGPTTASATGDGFLVVAQYDANPGGMPSFTASGGYFDVYAAPGNTFSQIKVVACDLDAKDKLFWWDPEQSEWAKASPQSYDPATDCVTLIVDADSSPSLSPYFNASQMEGTIFVAGQEVASNTAPVANPGGPYLGAINTAITLNGSLSADVDGDALTYAWAFGDGSTGTGIMPTHAYAAAGIYNVCLAVNDGALGSAEACTMAVVYDPSAGFVTGGGWIESPAGAYKLDESLAGKATFGFVSKYLKGATVPSGNTEFQFQAGGLNFRSTAYDWLVVSKDQATAQFKGSGVVNGAMAPNGNAYRFMLWAGDGSPDTFRIRLWWEDATGVEYDVYDNGFNQAIGGGSIVVHKSR